MLSLKDDMQRTKNKEKNIDQIKYLALDPTTQKKEVKVFPHKRRKEQENILLFFPTSTNVQNSFIYCFKQ